MTAKRHSVAAADPLRSGTSPAPVDRLPVADRDLWQNRVYVDVDAFVRNVRAIRAHVGRHREFLAVVKDD
ncbi:MAG: hypothetical protein V3T41_06580, partial [bacterium]